MTAGRDERRQNERRDERRDERRSFTRPLPVALAVVLALAIAAVVVTRGDSGGGGEASAPVNVTGDALGPFTGEVADDPAVGERVPVAEGTDLDGEPLTVGAPGRPAAVIFLAHWCPHCQAEVEALTAWLDAGNGFAEGVDVVGVSTLAASNRPNFPPDEWLDGEGWPFPTLADDDDSSVAQAWGLSGTPYWVLVDADGRVVQRLSGEIEPEVVAALVAALAAAP